MKKLYQNFLYRLLAAMAAVSVLMTSLPMSADATAATGQTSESIIEGEGAEWDFDEEDEEEADEDEPDYTTTEWTEQGVTGGEAPTLTAVSPDKFSGEYGAGTEAESNLYVLSIATGIKAGSDVVRYFAIRYKDSNDTEQVEYILMSDNPMKQSFEYVKSKGWNNTVLKSRHDGLSGSLNYTLNEPTAPGKSLSAWSLDEYLFRTENPIKEITGLEIFMDKGSWSVQSMSLSQVTKVGGFGEYGCVSGKYFMALSKKRICEMEKKKSGTLTISSKGDSLLRLVGSDSSYFGIKMIKDAKEDASPFSDIYTFRVDFSDVLDGGIETYLDLSDKENERPYPNKFVEELALEIEYKDRDNITRSVVMPVIMSALVQYRISPDRIYTAGFAQRGDTVAFTGYLPGYASLLTTKLYVGSTARSRLSESGGFKVKSSGKEAELDGESITISGISMYKGTCRLSNTEDGKDVATGATLKSRTSVYSFSEKEPMYYYIPSGEGRRLANGSKESINMKAYKSGDPLLAKVEKSGLLIRLMTDSKNTKSGTTGDLKVRLKYIDRTDNTVFSKAFNAKEETRDYMGYWPSGKNVKGDFAYLYGSKPGGCIEFYADVTDMVMLLSVVVETAADNTDEYQLGGISVCAVTDIGKRRIYKQDTTGEGDTSSYRIVRSSTNIAINPFPITFNSPQLFTAGTTYDYNVGGRSGDTSMGIPSSVPDFDNMRYSMSYEQTKLDFGFSRVVKTFDVNVKVADDSDVANSNGDSGSANKFYFQLQFKNGKSGYVQANQQLTADSFRAGYQEMFTISLNRDYGALTGISIMPEDLEDDETIYDKLNIESITVTEKTEGGSSLQYVIDDVGWIGIDYHDIAEASSIKGRNGRTASDIASDFSVSYQRHVVNLLCEITTLPGSIQDATPMSASVSCDLEYIDNNNEPQTISFDMVSRMADYMKKAPITYEAPTDGSLANYYTNMGTVSDPEWMLRPNHTDRFIMPSIPNLKSVKNLTIYALNRSKGTLHWNIGGVSISEILKDGRLSLTAEEEYYRNMSTAELCTMIRDDRVKEFTLPIGVSQSLKFVMTDNQLAWSTNTSWATPVTRLPDSTNDSINVFLYPSESTRNLDKDNHGNDVNVRLSVQYMERFSQVKQVNVASLGKYGSGTENAMFYVTGLSTPGMERLVSTSIRCYSNISFDKALVQHVRQGVVVANYTLYFMGTTADLGVTVKPSSTAEVLDPTRQRLLIELSGDTKESTLFAEQNDIAVAFRYRLSIGNSTREYYSPYVYLTDVGVSKIHPGMMLDIPFDIPYVAEVTGYRIASFGQIDAGVDGAMLINYGYSEKKADPQSDEVTYDGLVTKDIYSFNTAKKIENAVRQIKDPVKYSDADKDDNLTLLDLTFTIDEASNILESGTDEPVEMIFNYKDYGKRDRSVTFSDIRKYIQSGESSFITGESARVMLFLLECEELTSIYVRPTGTDGGGSLSIASMSGSAYPTNQKLTRLVDQVFTNTEGGTINLKEVRLKTTVRDYGTGGEATESVVANHMYSTLLDAGDKIELIPDIYVGEKGFTCKASLLVNGVETDVTSKYIVRNEGVVTFTAPKNNTTSPQTYSIVIASFADPNVYDTIIVTVPVPEPAAQSGGTDTGEAASSDTADTSSGTTGDASATASGTTGDATGTTSGTTGDTAGTISDSATKDAAAQVSDAGTVAATSDSGTNTTEN